ncbi:hypothetical protein [Rhizobium leguminosarum]|uniref:hypothetical protein n=1 Tax=Rhizobium leguminosarum TaxID=384 RepID=UPI001440E6DD|nr:hypothetical protein [Rhizobium leguminosarum]
MRALQTFSLNVRPEMLRQHCDLSHVGGLRNTQAAQAWRKLRARSPQEGTAQAFVGYANHCAARRIALDKRKRATREPPFLFRMPEWWSLMAFAYHIMSIPPVQRA